MARRKRPSRPVRVEDTRALMVETDEAGGPYATGAWVPCPCCENFICTIHRMHAHDCPCPPVEDWPRAGSAE